MQTGETSSADDECRSWKGTPQVKEIYVDYGDSCPDKDAQLEALTRAEEYFDGQG